MHLIARKILLEFSGKYPDSKGSIERWWKICKRNNFASFNELRKTFASADIVNKCIVFNIGGGKYRLIVRANFQGRRMWIKYIMTHQEYSKLNLTEDPKCLP